MTKYINNHKLNLGSNPHAIKKNLSDVLNYIYCYCPLDYDKMNIMYHSVYAENNYDFAEDNENIYEKIKIKFKNNINKDKKYFYKWVETTEINKEVNPHIDESFVFKFSDHLRTRCFKNKELVKE